MFFVRAAHTGELPILMAHSCRTAWAQLVPRQEPADFAATVERVQEMWAHAFRQGGTVLVLAEQAQAQAPPAAYALLAPYPSTFGGSPEMVVLDIWVDPGIRGQGAGAHILTAAEDYARRRGIPGLVAQVAVHNQPSLALFTRSGYQVERVVAGKRVSPETAT